MFGSVFKVRPKTGAFEKMMELHQEEIAKRGRVKGWVRDYVLQESNGDVWITAIFDSEESYRANAANPEQDKWYRRMRELLEDDPEWHDGVIRENVAKS
jgi:hypothetical protein